MINKGDFYLCVDEFSRKKDEPKYGLYSTFTNLNAYWSYGIYQSDGDYFVPQYTYIGNDSGFTVGRIYECVTANGTLLDNNGNSTIIDEEYIGKSFVKFNWKIESKIEAYIFTMKQKKVNVSIKPFALINFDKGNFKETGDISHYDVEYNTNMHYDWFTYNASATTQIESCIIAWKKLRMCSRQVSRIHNAFVYARAKQYIL